MSSVGRAPQILTSCLSSEGRFCVLGEPAVTGTLGKPGKGGFAEAQEDLVALGKDIEEASYLREAKAKEKEKTAQGRHPERASTVCS